MTQEAIGALVRTAAKHADDVDRRSRFPEETLAALRSASLLSAIVPTSLGGLGSTLEEISQISFRVAKGCGTSGMILAMHYIQLACIARHGTGTSVLDDFLVETVRQQYLIGSVTSEIGSSSLRFSVCGLEQKDGAAILRKKSPTISYGEFADALLVTCRSSSVAASNDQVLALLRRRDYELTRTSEWDALGMRGTASCGYTLEGVVPDGYVLPCPFAECAVQTMIPYAHILWSSVWRGIAADAFERAASFLREKVRGVGPDPMSRLVGAAMRLQSISEHCTALTQQYERLCATPDGLQSLLSLEWTLKWNNLKLAASETALMVALQCLRAIGIAGYKNDSPVSVARHVRDLLSAPLMISNERIEAANAKLLLVL